MPNPNNPSNNPPKTPPAANRAQPSATKPATAASSAHPAIGSLLNAASSAHPAVGSLLNAATGAHPATSSAPAAMQIGDTSDPAYVAKLKALAKRLGIPEAEVNFVLVAFIKMNDPHELSREAFRRAFEAFKDQTGRKIDTAAFTQALRDSHLL